jgi:hypothetical protein
MLSDTLVVYLPPERAFGWDWAENADDALTVGRVFRVVRETHRDVRPGYEYFDVEPYEGGESTERFGPFLVRLHILDPVMLPASVQLTSTETVETVDEERKVRWVHSLRLSHDFSGWNPLYTVPQKTLARAGLIPGQRYVVSRWVVPMRAVELGGVKGVYYSGLFEPAAHA